MTKVKASKARNDFPELIARAGYGGERFVIERRGKGSLPSSAMLIWSVLRHWKMLEILLICNVLSLKMKALPT